MTADTTGARVVEHMTRQMDALRQAHATAALFMLAILARPDITALFGPKEHDAFKAARLANNQCLPRMTARERCRKAADALREAQDEMTAAMAAYDALEDGSYG